MNVEESKWIALFISTSNSSYTFLILSVFRHHSLNLESDIWLFFWYLLQQGTKLLFNSEDGDQKKVESCRKPRVFGFNLSLLTTRLSLSLSNQLYRSSTNCLNPKLGREWESNPHLREKKKIPGELPLFDRNSRDSASQSMISRPTFAGRFRSPTNDIDGALARF